jgi:hypothetical protein
VRRFVGHPERLSLHPVIEAHDTLIVNPRIELIGEDEISARARAEAGAATAAGEKRKQVVSFFLATTSSTRRRLCTAADFVAIRAVPALDVQSIPS